MSADGAEWFYASGADRKGPVSTGEMSVLAHSGAIGRDTLVWTEGMVGWQPVREIALAGELSWAAEPPPIPAVPAVASFAQPSQGFGAVAAAPRPITVGPSSTMGAASGPPRPAAATFLPTGAAPQGPPPQYGAAPAAYGAAPSSYATAPCEAPPYGVSPYGAAPGTFAPSASPGPFEAIRICLAKYARFAGRASQPEYWWFVLFYVAVVTAGMWLDWADFTSGIQSALYDFVAPKVGDGASIYVIIIAYSIFTVVSTLVLALPMLSAMVRRLHDTDHSGWYYWMALIPLAGPIILLVKLCQRGTPGPNRFG